MANHANWLLPLLAFSAHAGQITGVVYGDLAIALFLALSCQIDVPAVRPEARTRSTAVTETKNHQGCSLSVHSKTMSDTSGTTEVMPFKIEYMRPCFLALS